MADFILIGAIVLFISVAAVLIMNWVNKKLHERIRETRERYLAYLKEIEGLKKDNPKRQDLENLNNFARNFFKKRFGLNRSLTYLELANEFRKRGNIKAVYFSKEMSDVLYSGEKVSSVRIKKLTLLFLDIAKKDLEFQY